MTLQEFYSEMGVDYSEVMKRLMKEDRVVRYLKLIAKEPNFGILDAAYENRDYEEIFKAAHAIKGLCMNLDLKPLADASSVLLEYMRPGSRSSVDEETLSGHYLALKQAFDQTSARIGCL